MVDQSNYPKLVNLLQTLTVDHNFCGDQFSMFVRMALETDHLLADEIESACSDERVSWRKMLNNETVGEVFETDIESEARDFAEQYLRLPAKQFLSGH